jgi:3' exoribonuclease family, domain 1
MNAESFRVLHPADYVDRFLKEGVRPDGRVFTGQRKVTVTAGTVTSANGSALVRCGRTSVVAGITGLVTFPSQHAPTHGMLEVSVQMSALCGRQFHAHRPSDDALALSQFLSRTVMRYACIPHVISCKWFHQLALSSFAELSPCPFLVHVKSCFELMTAFLSAGVCLSLSALACWMSVHCVFKLVV